MKGVKDFAFGDSARSMAKKYAYAHEYYGAIGGWIYDTIFLTTENKTHPVFHFKKEN